MSLKIKILSVLFFSISSMAFAQTNCKELKGCERKLCELNTKLASAKKSANQKQIKGIEDAISQTRKNCTTKTIHNDLDKKVKEKELKAKERTADLNKAIKDQEGQEKIAKKRNKLEEAKAELNKAVAAKKSK